MSVEFQLAGNKYHQMDSCLFNVRDKRGAAIGLETEHHLIVRFRVCPISTRRETKLQPSKFNRCYLRDPAVVQH